ncbi:alpha/beta hydrolase [Phenylobacterium sp.]|uniref:alpha/beta fold hydrolase n=1 Tax=Phenylobacterium sp. TaxID=1871053 RepID=UPI0025EC38C9|nr:alpha/beta hydrolase [Phenylobacterium sp.]
MTIILLLALALGAAALWLAARRAGIRHRQAIRSPAGIDETGFVSVGGAEQWVSIRGEDVANPVLVLLHGGPGTSFLPLGYEGFRAWERDFTLVQWDQPGAGRTFGRSRGGDGGDLSLDRIAGDGLEVVAHALRRLGQERAILLGVSWGSVLGIEMARRRPDLFEAYVGAGQVVDMAANEAVGYRELAERLEARGAHKALVRLREIGPPPYDGVKPLLAERKILMAHPPASERGTMRTMLGRLLLAPGYGLRQVSDWVAAGQHTTTRMLASLMAYSDDGPAPEIPVPVLIIQGDEDIQTPTSLAAAYFEKIKAPAKRWATLPGGGHNAILLMPDKFLEALKANLPLLSATDTLLTSSGTRPR